MNAERTNEDLPPVIAVDWEAVEEDTDREFGPDLRRVIEHVGSTSKIALERWGYGTEATTALFAAVKEHGQIILGDRDPLLPRYAPLRSMSAAVGVLRVLRGEDRNIGTVIEDGNDEEFGPAAATGNWDGASVPRCDPARVSRAPGPTGVHPARSVSPPGGSSRMNDRDVLDAPGQGRIGDVDDPVPDAEYRDETPEHVPPCDDCGEREATRSVSCPIDEDLRLDLCAECYEERGPGIEICHVQHDSDWDVNGGRAPARIEGAEKRHMNNTAFPQPGWIGNPHPMEEESDVERWRVLKAFRRDLLENVHDGEFFAYHLGKLRGKRVACWCRTEAEEWPGNGDPCHLDVVHAALMGVYRQE